MTIPQPHMCIAFQAVVLHKESQFFVSPLMTASLLIAYCIICIFAVINCYLGERKFFFTTTYRGSLVIASNIPGSNPRHYVKRCKSVGNCQKCIIVANVYI